MSKSQADQIKQYYPKKLAKQHYKDIITTKIRAELIRVVGNADYKKIKAKTLQGISELAFYRKIRSHPERVPDFLRDLTFHFKNYLKKSNIKLNIKDY